MRKFAIAILLVAAGIAPAAAQTGCGLHYVAAADDYPAGNSVSTSDRYPDQLMANHLSKWGAWCEYDIAQNGTTSSQYISNGQLAQTWNYRPDLITLQVGEENNSIKDLINSCFDKIKSHDFSGGMSCASAILGNTTLWSSLNSNLITIQQQYRLILAGRPKLVVAVLGYPNPYPHSDTATEKITDLCTPLVDTIPTCTARWAQLPPALDMLDQVFQKLNSTISNAVSPYAIATNGRFVYVDTYTKMKDHCMKMDVQMFTTVDHGEYVDEHDDTQAISFGCDNPYFVEGSVGTDIPLYLDPASDGVLTDESQTTTGMGVYPNHDGHKCLADLIWEADTIDPGTTPLKWKLGVPEAPNSNICQ